MGKWLRVFGTRQFDKVAANHFVGLLYPFLFVWGFVAEKEEEVPFRLAISAIKESGIGDLTGQRKLDFG